MLFRSAFHKTSLTIGTNAVFTNNGVMNYYGTLNIVGTDNTSTVVIVDNSSFGLWGPATPVEPWLPGTYTWDTATSSWSIPQKVKLMSDVVVNDVSSDVSNDVSTDVSSDVSNDVSNDVSSDVSNDISSDVSSDVSNDVSSDVSNDVSTDTEVTE